MSFEPTEHPHRRYNPLLGEYVVVSPHRMKRPWQGKEEKPPTEERPVYDPDCYLCPGNERAGGVRNPVYESTFVFTNDFAALLPDTPSAPESPHPLLHTESVQGACRVICFSPRHDLTLPEMQPTQIRRVVELWADQTTKLGERYTWVQVFENKGAIMGASNPHPHGQIWAGNFMPTEAVKEEHQQRAYYDEHGVPLLAEYAAVETERETRIIVNNDDWLVVAPYWAVWPFEALVLPRRPVRRLPDLGSNQRDALVDVLKRLLTRYDNLFETAFPYSMGWHGAPYNGAENTHWQLHAHFYPPLLRSATVRKFMVGYEMMAEAQRDLTAEQAAARLRDLPDVHYKM